MRCSHCNQNEAESIVYVDYLGQKTEMYLCNECMEQMRHYMSGLYQQFKQGVERRGEPHIAVPAAPSAEQSPEEIAAPAELSAATRSEGGAFPANAGDAIRDRRRLGELRALLSTAVQKEEYEQAAVLRDEIVRVERIYMERKGA